MTVPVAVAAATNGAAPAAPQTPANGATPPATADGKTPAQAKPVAPKPEQPWKAKRKLVIGGKEVEREYDDRRLQILEHNETQRADFLKEKAAYDARVKKLTEDPDAFFEESGIDVDALIEQRRARAEQMKSLTPEQQELAKLKDLIAKRDAADAKRAEQEATTRAEQEQQSFVQSNAKLFGETMKLAGVDKATPFEKGSYLQAMSMVRQLAHMNGEPDLTPEQLAAHTERFENKQFASQVARRIKSPEWAAKNADSLKEIARAVLPALEGDALLQWVGKENAVRFVKALQAKTRTSPVALIQEPAPVGDRPAAPNGGPSKTEWDILDGLGG